MNELHVPTPILPQHPEWLDLYRRATKRAGVRYGEALRDIPGQWPAGARSGQWWDIEELRRAGHNDLAAERARQYLNRAAVQLASPVGNRPLHHAQADIAALEVLAVLLEQVIGVRVWPGEDRIEWHLHLAPPSGLLDVRLGTNVVGLLAESSSGDGTAVAVEALEPFELEIENPFTTFYERVPAGRTRYLLTHLDRTDVRGV